MSVKLSVQFVNKTNENRSVFIFVCMYVFRIDKKMFSNTKVREFPSFQGISWSIKNTKGQTYNEPDVEMQFTTVRIFNGCEVLIENSVTWVTVRHHSAEQLPE